MAADLRDGRHRALAQRAEDVALEAQRRKRPDIAGPAKRLFIAAQRSDVEGSLEALMSLARAFDLANQRRFLQRTT